MLRAHSSFDHFCTVYIDPLIPVKLVFFQDIASILNLFLFVFQIDSPMILFLIEALDILIKSLCTKFIKKNIPKNSCTTMKLIKIDI